MKVMRQKQRDPEAFLGDGYGLVRFNKKTHDTTFECWPALLRRLGRRTTSSIPAGPVKFKMRDKRRAASGGVPAGNWSSKETVDPVVQVIRQQDGEVLYTIRIAGKPLPATHLRARGLHRQGGTETSRMPGRSRTSNHRKTQSRLPCAFEAIREGLFSLPARVT